MSKATTTETLQRRAEEALASGEHVAALKNAGEVLRVAPHDHDARMLVGHALHALGRDSQAFAAFRAAADLLAGRGFVLPAIAAFRRALQIWPDDLDVVQALGLLHERISGLSPTGRARVAPPLPPIEIDLAGGGSLLRYTDDEALIDRATQLATTTEAPSSMKLEPTYVPLFSDLSREAFVSLVGELRYHRFGPDHVIVREGEPGTSLFLLVSGEVDVQREIDGKVVKLAKLPGGSVFGEMALITAQRRQSTVVTRSPAELFEIGAEHVEAVARAHPAVTEALVAFARRRMLMNLMATSPIFKPFDQATRREILSSFRSRVVPEGEMIIREAADPTGLYLVASGEVQISKAGDDGEPVVLAHLREGEVFGEIALIQSGKTTATAVATCKTVLLHLDRALFNEFTKAHPTVETYLSELSVDRIEDTRERMHDVESTFDADDLILV